MLHCSSCRTFLPFETSVSPRFEKNGLEGWFLPPDFRGGSTVEQVLGPVGCTTVAWCPVALGDPANQLRGAQREGGEIDPTVLEPLGAESKGYGGMVVVCVRLLFVRTR